MRTTLSLIRLFLLLILPTMTNLPVIAQLTLENSKIKLITDGKHIISLFDKERNLEHIASDYTTANGVFGVSYVNSTTLANAGTINASAINTVTLVSNSATEARYKLENENIRAVYDIKLENNSASLVWIISIELKNASYAVSLVDFPRLRTPHSYGGKYKQFVEPTAEGLWRSMQTSIAWLRNYPGKLTVQMGTYLSTAGGFMMWTDDTTGQVKFGAPVIYRPQAWEKYGKWVGIDYFLVVIGDQNYINLNNNLKGIGITTSGFIEGYHWITRLTYGTTPQNNALNEFYIANNGPALVKSNLSCTPYTTTFEVRNTVFLCRGTDFGKTYLQGIANGLMDRGVSHVHNDFDHTVDIGGPCFDPDHRHPVPYGKWETEIMTQVVSDSIQNAKTREIPNFFISRENGFELHNMMNNGYQERNFHIVSERKGLVPLYTYIYHEYIPVIFGLASANRPRNVELCALIVYVQIPSLSYWTTAATEPTSNVINEATSSVLKDYYSSMKTHAKDFLLYGRMMPPIVESTNGAIHNTWDDGKGNLAVFAVDTLETNTTMSIRVPGKANKHMSVFHGNSLISTRNTTGGTLVNLDVPDWRLFSVVFSEYPLSIEKTKANDPDVRLYPNPVSQFLQIQLKNESELEMVNIYDINGSLLFSGLNGQNLNMAELNKGLNLVRLMLNHSSSIHKII
jgi:hypothetical protein